MTCVIGLDIGTTSIKAVLFDISTGKIISSANRPTPFNHPQPNYTEHDPELIWRCTAECIKEASQDYSVAGLSISCFAEAGLPLDSNGSPLHPIIAWFDPRSQPQVDRLLQHTSTEYIYQITGQKLGFSFGLMKILWLFENYPSIKKEMKYWMSAADYILYRLTGEIFTDFTQASRTLMFDQNKKIWSPSMLELADLEIAMLPQIAPSGTIIGATTKSANEITGLPMGTPCALGGHDHLCGAFASGGTKAGVFIDSMGTSQAVIALTDNYEASKEIEDQGFVNYAYVIPSLYLLKGRLKAGGKAVEWFQNTFREIGDQNAIILNKAVVENKPLSLPFFHGSGTPYRHPANRAVLFGFTANHTPEDFYFSLMEGFAFWLKQNVDAISVITGCTPNAIIAIGGANQNPLLQRIKASVLNIPLVVPSIPEASAVGAALLAAYGCGFVKSFEEAGQSVQYNRQVIEPESELTDVFQNRYQRGYIPLRKSLSALQIDLFENQ